ncbi:MAG: nitrophenyl compound nitroreductase subunit ArsF family protein [Planctomycetota bacterium]|jgi:thioredoxin 1
MAGRLAAFLIVVIAVVGVFALKRHDSGADRPAPRQQALEPLPRMVDLGADKCIPCKLMAPILKSLRADYAEHFEVVFIDVWKNRDAAREHGVRVIPTQIFYDADGTELRRHQGFFSRADILGTWRELGYRFPFVVDTTPPVDPSDHPGRDQMVDLDDQRVDEDRSGGDEPDPEEQPAVAPRQVKVIAYYLHWTVRCQSCLTIEATAQQALASAFAGALDGGSLEWHAHNMELPEYTHLMEAFDLSTSSLVLARMDGRSITRWKVLDKTWELVETPWDLETYVVNETRAFIAATEPPAVE